MGNSCLRTPGGPRPLVQDPHLPHQTGMGTQFSGTAPTAPVGLFGVSPMSQAPTKEPVGTGWFALILMLIQACLLREYLEATFDDTHAGDVDKSSVYNFYVGVALMMFVGFGYLMTFLKAYGLGAVGFTMLITCLGVEYAVVLESYMGKGTLALDFYSLLNGNFAVAAVLISFGGLIGKVSPTQLVVLTIVELTCYCVNKVYLLQQYEAVPLIQDCGGTIIIHVFGAYFGLCVCSVLGPSRNDELNKSSYTSDLFSFVGTVFLWLFWPSFVAGALPSGPAQSRALINTVLALLASTCVSFNVTAIMDDSGKIGTVPIQNATLAGGVSIGAVANIVDPFGALIIGGLAGLLSTVGFITTPMFGNVDTCGISNLHGMPGLFGGVVSVAVPLFMGGTGIDAGKQFLGLCLTLVAAVLTGVVTGLMLKVIGNEADDFDDCRFWECAEDSTPASVVPAVDPSSTFKM